MKGMKGKLLKKLKSISAITALRQGIVFQVNPPNQKLHASTVEPGDEIDSSFHLCGQDKIGAFLDSIDMFVPEKDLSELAMVISESRSTNSPTVPLPPVQLPEESETHDLQPNPLLNSDGLFGTDEAEEESEELGGLFEEFEEISPPGGTEAVILYTTSLRGIRKTFEDCRSVRFLLESFRVVYHERDVSMHMEFREELWRVLGGRIVPPRLFIGGRHIGGADEVVGLHEQGRLRKLLRGMPLKQSNSPCTGCGGVGFVVCFNCHGSRKVVISDELNNELLPIRCPECNENGLAKCPICC
ncbi:hypothetical protein U1Q18_013884 [Sarracenia purpurea var. burkii]